MSICFFKKGQLWITALRFEMDWGILFLDSSHRETLYLFIKKTNKTLSIP